MISLKLYKSNNSLIWKIFLWNQSQQQQIVSSSYQRTQSLVKFNINTCLQSEFSAQLLSKLNNFSLCRKRKCNCKNVQVTAYDSTEHAIDSFLRPEDDLISACGQNSKNTVSTDDSVHFIEEENNVIYVEFGLVLPSTLKLLQKSDN